MQGEVAKKIKASVSALLANAPAEIALETSVENFRKYVKDGHTAALSPEITMHIEESNYGCWRIAPDKDSTVDRYRCAFRMTVDDKGEIHSLKIDDEDTNRDLFFRPTRDVKRDLYRMYVSGTKIKIEPGTTHYDFNLEVCGY